MKNSLIKISILTIIILLSSICLYTGPARAEYVLQSLEYNYSRDFPFESVTLMEGKNILVEGVTKIEETWTNESGTGSDILPLSGETYFWGGHHYCLYTWDSYQEEYKEKGSAVFTFESSLDPEATRVVRLLSGTTVFPTNVDKGPVEMSQGEFYTYDCRYQSVTFQQITDYVNSADYNPGDNKVLDPINVVNGNMDVAVTDVSINSLGPDLVFDREYNSRSLYTGPLGYGWNHSLNQSLIPYPSIGVSYIDASGNSVFYTYNEGDTYTAPARNYSELVQNVDDSWTITKQDGTKYNFEIVGDFVVTCCLTSIVDRNGNALTLAYTDYLLTSVTDASDRELTFSYNADSFIETITDPASGTVSYTYDANDDLISVKDRADNETTYIYDANHNMIQIQDPENRSTYFSYDANDRATGSWNDDGYNKGTISYDPDNNITLVTGTDTSPLTVDLVTDVSHGTLVELNADGTFTYAPDTDYTGEDSFVYRVYDGTEYSATATVTITVTE